jgi:plasmid stabilization system protein ParE
MDLFDRCRLLLDTIADRVPPSVLAIARSNGDDDEWEAALITVMNAGIQVSPQEEDQLNDLLARLAQAPGDTAGNDLERRREFLVHPSHYQYYLRDADAEHDPEAAPLEEDELVSVHAAGHLVQVRTGMYGFDLPLTVEILDNEPTADLTAWQDVSEATAVLAGPVLLIESILTAQVDRFPLPAQRDQARSYRVRVHATGRAEAGEAVHVSADSGDPLTERHLIQVWPAATEPLKTWKNGRYPR